MTSHAACSKALKPLEILMRAVVTIVVSKAEMNRQNHRPAMMVCRRAGLMFGTVDGEAVDMFADSAEMINTSRNAKAKWHNASEVIFSLESGCIYALVHYRTSFTYTLKLWGQQWV